MSVNEDYAGGSYKTNAELESDVENLKDVIQVQGQMIEALYIALATRQNVPTIGCVHPEVDIDNSLSIKGVAFKFGECPTCLKDVAVIPND
ncbi:hypothetical protein [Streptomyces sp. NPDC048720]|uniref:hypothetical protein n=1 Tax=Streptomyces sp. NPDC048720 TaxID=3365588 RepID=UPI0037177638